MQYDENTNDPYVDENGVLKNLLGIEDFRLLQASESVLVLGRQLVLFEKPAAGDYNAAHVSAVHRFLFQDVYAWAGEFRRIGLSRGESLFCVPAFIESNLNRVGSELRAEKFLRGLALREFSERAAYYLGEWNTIHPFREGNGRTQRVLLTQLAKDCGFSLAWEHVTEWEMIAASIDSVCQSDNSGFRSLLIRCLRPSFLNHETHETS